MSCLQERRVTRASRARPPATCCREQTRELYAPFESNMKAVSSDVYVHEMPGGQYTNLKFQAMSLGLGDEWDKICKAYAAANRALGDIVKVRLHEIGTVPCMLFGTPWSKPSLGFWG